MTYVNTSVEKQDISMVTKEKIFYIVQQKRITAVF